MVPCKADIVIPSNRDEYALAPLICEIEGHSLGHKIIPTCQDASAAVNRNYGLRHSTSDIVIMCDDDTRGYYPYWAQHLVAPMLADSRLLMVSARLITVDGVPAPMMFGSADLTQPLERVPAVPTACCAIRRIPGVLFDEEYIGSGFEDTDYVRALSKARFGGYVAITNTTRIIHLNNQQNQKGPFYEHNRRYYLRKWGQDL